MVSLTKYFYNASKNKKEVFASIEKSLGKHMYWALKYLAGMSLFSYNGINFGLLTF